MHPTTVSQVFALIAVVTLSVAIAVTIYRIACRSRKRQRRATPVARTAPSVIATPPRQTPATDTPISFAS